MTSKYAYEKNMATNLSSNLGVANLALGKDFQKVTSGQCPDKITQVTLVMITNKKEHDKRLPILTSWKKHFI